MVVLRRKALMLLVACLVLLFVGIVLYQSKADQQLTAMGEMVGVVVAAKDIQPWIPVSAEDVKIRQVPRKYVDSQHINAPADVVGKMLSVAIPAGAGVPTYVIYSGLDLKQGERTWELRQTGNVVLDSGLQPGDRVDVMAAVTKASHESVQQILTGARVLSVQRKDKEFTVVLAVTMEQGKALMEVENFAKQVRVIRDPLAWALGGGSR